MKTSTPWVVTMLHEHFHQLQDSQPNVFQDVMALDLAGGDQTGMWMLNYPFPYKDEKINVEFEQLGENNLLKRWKPRIRWLFKMNLTHICETS